MLVYVIPFYLVNIFKTSNKFWMSHYPSKEKKRRSLKWKWEKRILVVHTETLWWSLPQLCKMMISTIFKVLKCRLPSPTSWLPTSDYALMWFQGLTHSSQFYVTISKIYFRVRFHMTLNICSKGIMTIIIKFLAWTVNSFEGIKKHKYSSSCSFYTHSFGSCTFW